MSIQIIYQLLNLLIGVMAFVVIVMIYVVFARWRNAKAVEGKILCHFFGPAGWYYCLCEYDGNLIKPPEGHHVAKGSYLIENDSLFGGHWKPGQMRMAQVGVQTTAFIENAREPIVSRDPDRWINSPNKEKITAIMMRNAINEAAMKTSQVLQMGVWKDIAANAQFIKRVPLMFLISLGQVVLLIILIYLQYSSSQSMSAIATMLRNAGY